MVTLQLQISAIVAGGYPLRTGLLESEHRGCGMERHEKKRLRRAVLARRDAMAAGDRAVKSAVICRELCLLARERNARTVAVYAAMGSEVDLDPFIRAAYESGMRAAFPAMLPSLRCGQRMQMRAVSKADYEAGAVPFIADPVPAFEPNSEQNLRFPAVEPRDIDLIVVPLVAFDAAGRRLGYGGGCYDRYLPALYRECAIVGAAFAEQETPTVPTDEHDCPLPRIICA